MPSDFRWHSFLVSAGYLPDTYKEDSIDELNRFINNEGLKFLIEDYLSEIEECEKILNDIRKREGGENLLRHFRIQ